MALGRANRQDRHNPEGNPSVSLNWLRAFRRKPAPRKLLPAPRALPFAAGDYDPVRAAFEAECG